MITRNRCQKQKQIECTPGNSRFKREITDHNNEVRHNRQEEIMQQRRHDGYEAYRVSQSWRLSGLAQCLTHEIERNGRRRSQSKTTEHTNEAHGRKKRSPTSLLWSSREFLWEDYGRHEVEAQTCRPRSMSQRARRICVYVDRGSCVAARKPRLHACAVPTAARIPYACTRAPQASKRQEQTMDQYRTNIASQHQKYASLIMVCAHDRTRNIRKK